MPRKNEKRFHSELIDAVRTAGGYGMRLQRQFIKGVPDVGLKHPRLPFTFVEVKHEVYAKIPKEIKVETSALQRQQIREMRKAGLIAGWCVFVSVRRKTYFITSMGQIYAEKIVVPQKLTLWDKSENALLMILQTL